MGLLSSRNPDPLSARSRALSDEIASLEAQIRELDAQLAVRASEPPPGNTATVVPESEAVPEPVFETVDHGRVTVDANEVQRGHYNELGVRKYDLAGAWRRIQRHLRGPAASNPRLIHYLAAGSIQGLRPLRYEARVARNRVLALSLLLLFVLWGLIQVLWR